jgi:hypothetical protein
MKGEISVELLCGVDAKRKRTQSGKIPIGVIVRGIKTLFTQGKKLGAKILRRETTQPTSC